VGKPSNFKNQNAMSLEGNNMNSTMFDKQFYIGSEAIDKRGMLSISRPISKGFVNDWDD